MKIAYVLGLLIMLMSSVGSAMPNYVNCSEREIADFEAGRMFAANELANGASAISSVTAGRANFDSPLPDLNEAQCWFPDRPKDWLDLPMDQQDAARAKVEMWNTFVQETGITFRAANSFLTSEPVPVTVDCLPPAKECSKDPTKDSFASVRIISSVGNQATFYMPICPAGTGLMVKIPDMPIHSGDDPYTITVTYLWMHEALHMGRLSSGPGGPGFMINDHCYGAVPINVPGSKPDCHTFAKSDQGWLSTVSADSLTLFARGSTDLSVGRSQDPTHVGACKVLLAGHDPNMMDSDNGGGCSVSSRRGNVGFTSLLASMTLLAFMRNRKRSANRTKQS